MCASCSTREERALVEATGDKEQVDRITAARQLFEEVALADDFADFLTLPRSRRSTDAAGAPTRK